MSGLADIASVLASRGVTNEETASIRIGSGIPKPKAAFAVVFQGVGSVVSTDC